MKPVNIDDLDDKSLIGFAPHWCASLVREAFAPFSGDWMVTPAYLITDAKSGVLCDGRLNTALCLVVHAFNPSTGHSLSFTHKRDLVTPNVPRDAIEELEKKIGQMARGMKRYLASEAKAQSA